MPEMWGDEVMNERYTVEQLGPYDWGVWDSVREDWAYEGFQSDAEVAAERLNRDAD